ncbi:5-dehydro-2-deoxygluconokinase [Candidatus Mycoplasma pogonae]
MQKKMDFLLLGRVTIDFNPTDYYNTLEKSTTFKKYLGGSTGNTAVGLSRLGNKVGFIGKVSNDQFGNFVADVLAAEKVDISHLYRHPSYKLGLTFTEMLSKDKSSILMYRNQVADLEISMLEISEQYIASAKALIVSGTALSKSPSREAVLKAVLLAKQNHVDVIFDVDYREYSWTSIEEVGLYYQLVAKQADLIIGSREEMELTSRFIFNNNFNDVSDQDLADYWLKTAKLVIIKNGKQGSKLFTKHEHLVAEIVPVEMLKGYGGGDAYASLFLHLYYLDPNNTLKALQFATSAASIMVQSHSSFDLPSFSTIEEFVTKALRKNPNLVKKVK